MKNKYNIFLSADPLQRFERKLLAHPLIKGIRINTGAAFSGDKKSVVNQFKTDIYPLEVWIDLKCRELRLIEEATIPQDPLVLNHSISVKTPCGVYYNEGKEFLIIDQIIDGNKLKIRQPKNKEFSGVIRFGKGTSLNIPEPSLKVEEFLTRSDKDYVHAAKDLDIHNYFLSYVEKPKDLYSILDLDPEAQIFAKIESERGLDFVKNDFEDFKESVHLIAARADLYIELAQLHHILNSLKLIIKKDPDAIVASRLLLSFLNLEKIPLCADICDVGYLLELGFKNFLFCDDLCKNQESLAASLGLMEQILINYV
ncbi:MAG: hypothetical protein GF383_01345 [Candidatus Lokiarchaeota archaeon]|nr:hypothetical protein [Candidatus Lokiarchaeota archaeon]MBD3337911.1 hypothetical protein [Candidatus Lokiarchaeota archaeon]